MASKYGKNAQEKVEKAVHERKRGTLKSGSGKKVKSRKQAIAIGLSEARREGGKVPAKKSPSRSPPRRRNSSNGKFVTDDAVMVAGTRRELFQDLHTLLRCRSRRIE